MTPQPEKLTNYTIPAYSQNEALAGMICMQALGEMENDSTGDDWIRKPSDLIEHCHGSFELRDRLLLLGARLEWVWSNVVYPNVSDHYDYDYEYIYQMFYAVYARWGIGETDNPFEETIKDLSVLAKNTFLAPRLATTTNGAEHAA